MAKNSVIEIGTEFERWTVIGEPISKRVGHSKSTRVFYPCRCSCPSQKEKLVPKKYLLKGVSRSCGCLSAEKARDRMKKLGDSNLRHGESQTVLHKKWWSMIARCTYESCEAYPRYGGRGIKVCEEWLTYENFRDWAFANGYQEKLTLDRIDNDKGYLPSNCRWVTTLVQNRNRSINVYITALGETKCIGEWAADPRCQVKADTLAHRIKAGWSHERGILTPPMRRSKQTTPATRLAINSPSTS